MVRFKYFFLLFFLIPLWANATVTYTRDPSGFNLASTTIHYRVNSTNVIVDYLTCVLLAVDSSYYSPSQAAATDLDFYIPMTMPYLATQVSYVTYTTAGACSDPFTFSLGGLSNGAVLESTTTPSWSGYTFPGVGTPTRSLRGYIFASSQFLANINTYVTTTNTTTSNTMTDTNVIFMLGAIVFFLILITIYLYSKYLTK